MENNSIAMVTGASRLDGIGAAASLLLAEKGYDIFFTSWRTYDKCMPWFKSDDDPNQLKKLIEDKGVRCEWIEIDFMEAGAHTKLIDCVNEKLGSPSVLINNATYSTSTSVETLSEEELDRHYKVNVRATSLLTTNFITHFHGSTGGRIVNITSGQSLGAMPDEIAYAITKSSIETLTKTLASVAAKKGITINAVNPGPTDTGWINKEMEQQLLPLFPQGRIGVPSDAANLIGFLVSSEAQWITGQILHSEGGFMR